jgi:hypothetical protein
MIDTVCLLIPKDKVTTLDIRERGVEAWDLHSKTDQYKKYVKNPSKKDSESGLYFPRLTAYKRQDQENIRIEFSAPKLLYQNNLDELGDSDFPKIIEALQERLYVMGLIIKRYDLERASVSSVHYSKNILLEDGFTVNYLISEMNKVNLVKSFDFARARYINDGQSLYAHTSSHQLVIYDKVADLGKEAGRAIDKDQPSYQRSLFNDLQKNRETEIIRFEARLAKKQKMNGVFEGFGYAKNPIFKDVFNSKISKAVINDYWNKIIKERSFGLFSLSVSPKEILRIIFTDNKKIKPKQAIYLLGLITVAKDENGLRELRSITARQCSERTWFRTSKDMRLIGELIAQNKLRDWVSQIDKKLEDYKPYKHILTRKLSTLDVKNCKV